MGFYYRKSKSFGPFRINLSKSGIGYSVGGKGFRTGVSASGRRYTSFNLPGTGLGYRTSNRGGCGFVLLLGVAASVLAASVAAAAFGRWILA